MTRLERILRAWNALDEAFPLASTNDIAARVGCEPPVSSPGDRFERGQTDIKMYWPAVLP